MKVDKELTKRLARELLPRRVLVTQSIVLLDEYVELFQKKEASGKEYSAQLKGPELLDARPTVFEDLPCVEFLFETGYRLVPTPAELGKTEDKSSMESNISDGEAQDSDESIALIALTLRLIMVNSKATQYSKEELVSFGTTSGAFQVWPYFREFIHSSFVRAGLNAPPVSMFMLRDE